MDAVTGAVAIKAIQELSNLLGISGALQKGDKGSDPGSFDSILQSVLEPEKAENTQKAAVFAATIEEHLGQAKGPEMAAHFRRLKEINMAAQRGAGAPLSEEAAARKAVGDMAEAGYISDQEAELLLANAVYACQNL